MVKNDSLNRYQKGILALMIVMVLIFSVVYFMTISRVGFEYEDAILVPSQENGSMVYSGKIQGKQAQFTVSEDQTVVFQHGNETYGPYMVKEDPTAIPKDAELAEHMTGVEIRKGEEILFRGGVLENWGSRLLYDADGTQYESSVTIIGGRIEMVANGDAIDPLEPTVSVILDLVNGPELTHKGGWLGWLGGVFICIFNALFILFADELFRWQLAFRIHNADNAEPSDWEIGGRYIGWTVLTIVALAVFVIGLQ